MQVVFEVIHSLGFMIGFAWEGAFQRGVEALGHFIGRNATQEMKLWLLLTLSSLVVAMVVPAWILYIQPKALGLPRR